MKSILNELGVVPYINAHDTITLYGASRMEESTIEAMNQIAECFTDIPALQANLGDRIAKMTHNDPPGKRTLPPCVRQSCLPNQTTALRPHRR